MVFSTTGSNVDCNFSLFGESLPKYELTFNNQMPLTGAPITGFLKNTSSEAFNSFKLFDWSSSFQEYNYEVSSNLSGLKIKPNNSGQVILNFSGDSQFILNETKTVSPLSGTISLSTTGTLSIRLAANATNTENYTLRATCMYSTQ